MVRPGKKYPIQVVLMVSTDVGQLVEQLAARENLKKTEILRSFVHAGMKVAGYSTIDTTDPVGTDKIDLGPR